MSVPIVSSRTSALSRTSPSTTVRWPCSRAQSRLLCRPRTKLSRTTTSAASASISWSTMVDPIVPAPPVTSIRLPAILLFAGPLWVLVIWSIALLFLCVSRALEVGSLGNQRLGGVDLLCNLGPFSKRHPRPDALAQLAPRESAEFRVLDPGHAPQRGAPVAPEEGEAGEHRRRAAADLERPQGHPEGVVVEDPGALAVPGAAAQAAIGRAPRAMVASDEVVEGAGLIAAHAGVGLVDRVPGELLGDAPDRFQALATEELHRPVHVVGGDLDPGPAALAVGLDQAPAREAQGRVLGEALDQGGEPPRRQLDVAVELADEVITAPIRMLQADVEST